jgi:ribosomal protein S18 acetylase RimI-like enzyme
VRIEPLTAQHDVSQFDCGEDSLNKYIRFALKAKQMNLAGTFVCLDDDNRVIGFYARVWNSVTTDSLGKPGVAKHPVAVMLLAQFGVVIDYQKRGVGKMLMRHFFEGVMQNTDQGDACFAVIVDALNERAKRYYIENYGFKECVDNPSRLFLLTKTVKKAARRN